MADNISDAVAWRDALDAYINAMEPRLRGIQRLLRLEQVEDNAGAEFTLPVLTQAIQTFEQLLRVARSIRDELTILIEGHFPTTPKFTLSPEVLKDLIDDRMEIDLALQQFVTDLPTTEVMGEVGPERPSP